MKTKYKISGFTLVELLVVIAIVGLLAAVTFVAVNGARGKARDARRLAERRQIKNALNYYYDDHNAFPSGNAGWTCFGAPSSENCWLNSYTGSDSLLAAMQPYLATMPTATANSGNYAYNRFLYVKNATISGATGAWLIWYKENTMSQPECESPYPIQHYDQYYYCYEYLNK